MAIWLHCYMAIWLLTPPKALAVVDSIVDPVVDLDYRPRANYVPGEVIVKFKEGQSPQALEQKAAAVEARGKSMLGKILNQADEFRTHFAGEKTPKEKLDEIVRAGDALNVQETLPSLFEDYVLIRSTDQSIARLLGGYRNLDEVEFVEPNYIVHAHETPNDEHYAKQWGLAKIAVDQAWNLTHGSSSVKVAVLDTGIDQDHPDLSSKVEQWVNFSSSSSADDYFGHGTHTAGIVSAVTNNQIGVAGTGYDIKLLSVKVLGDDGSGSWWGVSEGIRWAVDNGAKVISMSLGDEASSDSLEQAVNYAWSQGVVVVASAGNCGAGCDTDGDGDIDLINPIEYPAYYENVIAVAATGPNDEKASYSEYGNWVDVAAPGGNGSCEGPNWQNCIVSTYLGGQYAVMKGTSMSCPFVSGLAGLLFSANPSLTAAQVRNLIESKADKISGTGSYWTHGRINAYESVLAAMGNVTVTPTPTGEVTPTPTVTPTPGGPTTTPTPTVTPGGPTVTPTPINQATPSPTPTPRPCPLDGDYNQDGTVNNLDFEGWKQDFIDGNASLSCFEYWRRNKY